MTKFEIGGHQSKEFNQSHNIIIDVDVDMKAIVKFYLIVLIVYVIG